MAIESTVCCLLVAMTIAQPVVQPGSSAAPPAVPVPAGQSSATTRPSENPRRPPEGLLTPIPENGGLPAIYSKLYDLTAEQIRHRGVTRQYAKQIRRIRHEHFGAIRSPSIRQDGIDLLAEFTDPAAFAPMIEELEREKEDVKLGLMDHFRDQGDEGQAALAWMAIHESEPAIRNEALRRMVTPVREPVRYVLNAALRSKEHEVANAAASLAGALNVIEAIPLLIFAQATATGSADSQGDLAWIAIQTQRAYVQNLVPVVGDGSGAFQPVVGIVSEGVVMRVVDAVVIEYRTPVHGALVNLTSNDWGQPTDYLGYNIRAWWDWFNTQYVPYKREQAQAAELAGQPRLAP